MTALLGLLAVAGYQNRDKIAEMLRGVGTNPSAAPGTTAPGATAPGQGGLGGVLSQLGNTLGGAGAGGFLSGGLGELMDRFKQNGQGDAADSWVGTGPNQPVDPQRLGSALGSDAVNQLSSKSGLDVGSLLPMLAAFLPQIINALTPDGKVPAGGAGGGIDIGSILAGLGGSARSTGAPAMGSDPSVGDIGSILDGK